ncbi:hypothetical protein GCM10027341_32060 [Spirosoma knui]
MRANRVLMVVMTVFISAGAYAQTQPHAVRPKLTPEQREARKAERQAKLAQMTPAERKAFKLSHRDRVQARLNAMTPEQRAQFMERKRQRKALKSQEGN